MVEVTDLEPKRFISTLAARQELHLGEIVSQVADGQ
jgi:hypothetical protein